MDASLPGSGSEWGGFDEKCPFPEDPHADLPSMPEWDAAIAADTVQLRHIAEAYKRSKSSRPKQETRALFSSYYRRLLNGYAKANGAILSIGHSKSGRFHALHTAYGVDVIAMSLPTTSDEVVLWEMVERCT